MEILRAIERADALCPNSYVLEEKLCWCDEVTAELRRSILKVYDIIETTISDRGELLLPDGFSPERIETVIVGDKMLEKQDFRSFGANTESFLKRWGIPKVLKAVFLSLPQPIRRPDIRGSFNTGENYIELEESPFLEGDKLEIAAVADLTDEPDWTEAERTFVMEVQPDKIILDRDVLTPQTEAKLAIRRVITDCTEIDEAPYDGMYIEYILAKMAFYQHDYTAYNAHMMQYNTLFEQMRREYKARSPLTNQSNFKNYSIV